MQGLPEFNDPNLIIGAEHFSDAGVYRIADNLAMVQSVDFFPPLVDDPFVYGQIAAANSMSDIYAMGGKPTTVLNIVCYPDDKLGMESLGLILQGGSERVLKAGAVILGGHSVRDDEIKYGMAVTGLVDPDKMMSNHEAKPGDVLVLTKGLGTGFITTAFKASKCPDDVFENACKSMVTLNKQASEIAVKLEVKGTTDITGFGLAGHGLEMAQASKVTIEFDLDALPLLDGSMELAKKGFLTRANPTNLAHVKPSMLLQCDEKDPKLEFLFDPQTSGGLLIAIAAEKAEGLVTQCKAAGLDDASIVGRVCNLSGASLVIKE